MERAQVFGRFWLHEKIGHGRMAEVIRATMGPDADRYSFDFAIKRLHPHLFDDQRHKRMFQLDAYVSKLLIHPNIVRVYESGETNQLFAA